LLIGNSTGNTLTKATLTAGTGITVTNSAGGITIAASGGGGSGDVVGPASATDNALVRFDTTTGKLVQNSVGILSDAGVLTGLTGLTSSGSVTLSGLTSGRMPYASTGGLLADSANLLYSGTDLTVYGLTVGRGAGAVATNTAVGASALAGNTSGVDNHAVGYLAMTTNTSGSYNVALGSGALKVSNANQNAAFGHATLFGNTSGANNTAIGSLALNANTTASNNTAVGKSSLPANTTGASNTAVGTEALQANTTASYNTALGYQAGYTNQTGANNTYFGYTAGYTATGGNNTFIGSGAGYYVTTGAKNTILGNYTGNQNSIDIRTGSNYVVLSDGDGNPLAYTYSGATFCLQGAGYPQTGTGITFPATQSASSNANTLDDYEEGTWTPTLGGTGSNPTGSGGGNNVGHYVKVGRAVHVRANISFSAISGGSGNARISGLPFASSFYWTALTIGYRGGSTAVQPAACMVEDASTNMQFWKYSSTSNPQTGVDQEITVANMGTSFDWYIEGTYFTS
jgi:hypothetical protein